MFTRFVPVIHSCSSYNPTWLYGDAISGFTVALVLVPQSLSYAQIATLPAEYGLYSAFAGVAIYTFFSTSKDVTVGPVAVMSLTVAQIIKNIQEVHPDQWGGPQIATTLAMLCGLVVLLIGAARLGWIVEFIPAPAIGGFMTGSAITIIVSQLPGLLGITVNSRGTQFEILWNLLKNISQTRLDAVFGLTGIVFLYAYRFYCDRLSKQYPKHARKLFFLSALRHATVIVALTIVSWLYTHNRKGPDGKYPIRMLLDIPSGFQAIQAPVIDRHLVKALAGQLPVACIIILLEHIAITKSFGRSNNYRTDPNQELIALGLTNTFGTFFSTYPTTASFTRSALKSATGVYTPISGLFTAILLFFSIQLLTPAFYYIPNATLNAVIIHAVGDLAISSFTSSLQYWNISYWEGGIWAASVFVTLAKSVEWGIWTAVGASFVLLLVRISSPRGQFLGKFTLESRNELGELETRPSFLPLQGTKNISERVINSRIKVEPPAAGVIIYRLGESCTYPNAALVNSSIVEYVKKHTKQCGSPSDDGAWNEDEPVLRAIVLDFSAVAHIDVSGAQALVDTWKEVNKWSGAEVQFHFASVQSTSTRNVLLESGFGRGDGTSFSHEAARTADGFGDTPEPVISSETPFFHFDLIAAVRAAERTVLPHLIDVA